MRRQWFATSTSLLLLAGTSLAASAQDNLAHCVAIDDDSARLACFDEATGRTRRSDQRAVTATPARAAAPAAVSPGAPPPIPTTAPSTASASAPKVAAQDGTENFGLSSEQLENTPDKISAVVRSVAAQSHYGRWVVTLDNGQVWEQRETTAPAKRPRPGDPVTIEKSSFGSYLLVAPGRGSNRVKRIR